MSRCERSKPARTGPNSGRARATVIRSETRRDNRVIVCEAGNIVVRTRLRPNRPEYLRAWQIAAALPEDKRALIVELADNHARHVWLQQEAAYHLGLAVGRRLRLRKEH